MTAVRGRSFGGVVEGPGRALGVAVLVALVGVGAGVALVVLALVVARSLGAEFDLVGLIVIATVLSQAGFVIAAIGYLAYTGRGIDYLGARFPSGSDVVWMVGGYVLALGLAAVGAIVSTLARAPRASNQAAELGIQQPVALLLLVPLSFLVIGPGEELLFRGTVQARLRESFGPWVAVVTASALFAGLHVLALTGGLAGRLVTAALLFLPSLVLGVAYERTRNLVVTAFVHGAYDATLFGLLYIAVQYGPQGA